MGNRKLLNRELCRISAEEYRNSPESGIAVVLDNVRSAHNVGSVFRTCDAFRADLLCLCGICAVPPSPEIRKAALGAENSVAWERFASTGEAVAELRKRGYRIVSVEQTEKSVMLGDCAPEPGVKYALVFGNEVEGVSQEVVDSSDMAVEIPQYGTKHSLNVSVSAGIVLWQFRRFGRQDSAPYII